MFTSHHHPWNIKINSKKILNCVKFLISISLIHYLTIIIKQNQFNVYLPKIYLTLCTRTWRTLSISPKPPHALLSHLVRICGSCLYVFNEITHVKIWQNCRQWPWHKNNIVVTLRVRLYIAHQHQLRKVYIYA